MDLQWAKTWMGFFNEGDLDRFMDVYAPDVQFRDVPMAVTSDDPEGIRDFLAAFLAPGAGRHRFLPDTYLGNAKGGVIEWAWEGELGHADLFGLGHSSPGTRFRLRGNSVLRFNEQAEIVEHRDYWDFASVLRQLDAL